MPKSLNWKFCGSFDTKSDFEEYLKNDGTFVNICVKVSCNNCTICNDGHSMRSQYGFYKNILCNVIKTCPRRCLTLTCLEKSIVEKQNTKSSKAKCQ